MTKIDDITISVDEPMSKHTSWRAGGVAKRFVQAASLPALASYVASLPESENIFWLGLGSNTLVRDGGFDGTIIATQGVMNQLELIDEQTVYAGAGVSSAKLARFCSNNGLCGAEFFAGIPGLVGGALAMNAGAWGGVTWTLVRTVETLDRKGVIRKRDASDFEYGYRHVKGPEDEWFISATLAFDKPCSEDNTIDIKQLLAKRSAAQPTGVASCGSVFRNPTGAYAAQLIQDCGLKGHRIGGAVISMKHANFIINDEAASAADIEDLINLAQDAVKEKFGIALQVEAKIIGDPVEQRTSDDRVEER